MPTPRKAPAKARGLPKKAQKPSPPSRSPRKSATKGSGKKAAPAKPGGVLPRSKGSPAKAAVAEVVPEPPPTRTLGRAHLLSLSFLRDGDEFLARMETDSGQITELKNRFLDQLLSLVANELEDLLE
jgi:hypothetical protein